jgi:hypothetical protein
MKLSPTEYRRQHMTENKGWRMGVLANPLDRENIFLISECVPLP